jgi:hypothetical protein
MNTDVRLLLSFKGHRKRLRLKQLLGEGATDYLIDLWITVAQDRPDGVLTGWDEFDIAVACRWPGDPATLIAALTDSKCQWLDRLADGTYAVHDWPEHQPHCIGSKDRSDVGRIKALIRHHGKEAGLRIAQECGIEVERLGFCTKPAGSMQTACKQHAGSMQAASRKHAVGNAPSPSPLPSPSPSKNIIKESSTPGVQNSEQEAAGGGLPADIAEKVNGNGKGHWSNQVGGWFETIKTNGEKLVALSRASPGKSRFNPWQMIQQLAKERFHPGAIAEITDKLVKMWPNIEGNPYQYINAFRKSVKQNWNEREAIKIHEEFKRMDPGALHELSRGLFGSI